MDHPLKAKRSSILTILALPIQRKALLKLLTRLARLELAVLGSLILVGLLQLLTTRAQSSEPVLRMIKSGPDMANVGDTVAYAFTVRHAVTSDGSPVSNVTVSDDVAGLPTLISGDTNRNNQLDVDETWIYIATYTIQLTDPDPLVNIAIVEGENQDGDNVTASDTHSSNVVRDIPVLYLPLMLTNYLPPRPCFVETFDNSASGWSVSLGPPTLLEYIDGKYHVFTQDTSVLHWARSPLGPYSNYSVQVDVNWANTTHIAREYGIVFDLSTSNGLVMYRFNIDTTAGTYALGRLQGIWTTLVHSSSSDILGGTSVNVLKVERNRSNIDLYINGKYQSSYADSMLPRPAFMGINIVPDDLVNGEAYFDNFTICSSELSEGSVNSLKAISNSGVTSKP